MNKFTKWIIKKLGGYTDIPKVGAYEQHKIYDECFEREVYKIKVRVLEGEKE